jgi:F-type H+-transporting ATPase subunit gamma
VATTREIKRRINSIKNTEKITRAMKMVAAVKFRKAQEAILAARPYAHKIDSMIKFLLSTIDELEDDLLKEREMKRVALMVVTADRGLCGSFNTNLIKTAQTIINTKYSELYQNHNLSIIAVGKKSYDYFSRREFDIYSKYVGVFDGLNYASAREIIKDMEEGYKAKKFDKIVAVYNEFKNVVQSKIIEEQLLPIVKFSENENPPRPAGTPPEEGINQFKPIFIFEPSVPEIINYLLPKHLNTQMWRILLESNAAEQGARMTAMDSATKNANDLINYLQLHYNKARQAGITKEILEVVAGAEALRESG